MNITEDLHYLEHYLLKTMGISIPDTNKRYVIRFVQEELKKSGLMIQEYINTLNCIPESLHQLINAVTINETYFFREYKHYLLLSKKIFKEMKEKTPYSVPTVWSAAASYGTEALSLAVLLAENWPRALTSTPVYASDIDIIALKSIENNLYSKSLLKEDGQIFHTLMEKYTTPENLHYISFQKSLLSCIKTFPFNLLKDSCAKLPFKADVIFLCNVLTYMSSEKKDFVIENILSILNDGGHLILSSTDTPFVRHKRLKLLEFENSFYFQKLGESNA